MSNNTTKNLLIALILWILAIILVFAVFGCEGRPHRVRHVQEKVVKDTIPTFTKTADLIAYRDYVVSKKQEDSIFYTLPEPILRNVTDVVINRYGKATQLSVITEYLANAKVYDNLNSKESEPIVIRDTIYINKEPEKSEDNGKE